MTGAYSIYGGEQRCIQVWLGNLKEMDRMEDTAVDGRLMLRWIFRMWDVGSWTVSIWLKIKTRGGHLEMT